MRIYTRKSKKNFKWSPNQVDKEIIKKYKTKKHGVSWWKTKCWTLFSEIVRDQGCERGYGNCVTCGKRKHFSELQAGHFIQGRHNSILFDFRGCHPQCFHCNIGLKGNVLNYYDYMKAKYGMKVINELRRLDKQTKQFKVYELEELHTALKLMKYQLSERQARKDEI
jgi:hypothetical protein